MARPDKERKGQAKKHGAADSRFAAMHSDPRFARMPKAQRRVEIDSRFKGVFDDDDFQMKSAIDKRGRKVERAKVVDNMRRFYRLEGEEEVTGTEQKAVGKLPAKRIAGRKLQRSLKGRGDNEDEEEDTAQLGDSVQDDDGEVEDEEDGQAAALHEQEEDDEGEQNGDEEEEEEEEEATVRALRIRGMMPSGDSGRGDGDGEEDSDDEEDEEDEEELVEGEWEEQEELDLAEWGVGAMAGNPEEDIPMVEETHRLVAVDLEWSAMRAVDILAILNSFLPAGGLIQKVTVYPSDYGLVQMAEERVKGPQGIFIKSQRISDGDGDDDDDEEDGGELDRERLRLYERSKLRWHYAVIVCDSTATASHLYKECDGMELEESSCRMDLRFVSDEQSFAARKIRDEAREVPHDYAPPSFANTALQHTDPDLTWDKDDAARRKLLRRRMTEESLMEDDLKVYLASGTSESDDDGQDYEDELKRRRQVLLGQASGAPADGRARSWAAAPAEHGDEDDEHEDDEDGGDDDAQPASRKGDMEVTFNSGLESLSKRLLSGKKRKASDREGEALFKGYAARKAERKQEQRALGRANVESGSDDSDDGDAAEQADAGFDDPFFDEDGGDFNRAEAVELAGGSGRKPRRERQGKSGRRRDASDEEPAGPKSRAESQRQRAELELLMMDDDALNAARAGFQPPSAAGGSGDAADTHGAASGGGKKGRMSLKERRRLKAEEKRRRRHRQGDDNEEAGARADHAASVAGALADPRFSALMESADYALDPTAPDFKRTPSNARLAAEVSSRLSRHRGSKLHSTGNGGEAAAASGGDGIAGARQHPTAAQLDAQLPAGRKAAELKVMVANLKRRAPLPDANVGDGDQAAHLAGHRRRGKAKGQKQWKKDRGPGTLKGAARVDQRK